IRPVRGAVPEGGGLVSRRDDIAAALAVIPGLDPKPYQPDTLHPGECWPLWVRTTWLTDCSHEETYDVNMVLPAGAPALTSQVADALPDPVFEALSQLGAYIDAAEPASTIGQDGGNPIPLLRVTIRITS